MPTALRIPVVHPSGNGPAVGAALVRTDRDVRDHAWRPPPLATSAAWRQGPGKVVTGVRLEVNGEDAPLLVAAGPGPRQSRDGCPA